MNMDIHEIANVVRDIIRGNLSVADLPDFFAALESKENWDDSYYIIEEKEYVSES